MDFETQTAPWDPLGAQIPAAQMSSQIADADRAMQSTAPVEVKKSNVLALLVIAGVLFVFGNFVPLFVYNFHNTALQVISGFSSWLLALPFLIVALVKLNAERMKYRAAEQIAKMRYAKSHGWVVRMEKNNRFKELRAAFPAFMHPPGSASWIGEEWWGVWKSGEKEYAVWLAELQYQVSAGKHTRTEYSPIVGVKLRNNAPVSVNLAPEGIAQKVMQFFRGEYKTGNAEFDAAFSIGTAALQESSMLSSVLTPPFIAALMQYRLRQPITVLRERDLLLVRYASNRPMLPIDIPAKPGAASPDSALQAGINRLVEPVVAIVEQAGL